MQGETALILALFNAKIVLMFRGKEKKRKQDA